MQNYQQEYYVCMQDNMRLMRTLVTHNMKISKISKISDISTISWYFGILIFSKISYFPTLHGGEGVRVGLTARWHDYIRRRHQLLSDLVALRYQLNLTVNEESSTSLHLDSSRINWESVAESVADHSRRSSGDRTRQQTYVLSIRSLPTHRQISK